MTQPTPLSSLRDLAWQQWQITRCDINDALQTAERNLKDVSRKVADVYSSACSSLLKWVNPREQPELPRTEQIVDGDCILADEDI